VRSERERFESTIERDASVIATYVVNDLANGSGRDLQPIALDYSTRTGGRVVITDARGLSVADSDSGPTLVPAEFGSRPEVSAALFGRRVTGHRFSTTLGSGLTYVAVPVASSGVVHGAVRITYSSSAVDRAVRDRLVALAISAAIGLGAAVMVAWAMARSLNRPLAGLRDTTIALARGDLSARADESDGPRELRDVAQSFNAMADRIDELVGTQRSFVADASHQLRTPLTALRLRLDQLRSEQTGSEAIAAAFEETGRLQRIVEGLLTLARGDGARPDRHGVDAAALVAERAEMWGPLADEVGVSLVTSVPDVRALAQTGALEQVLDNLLDNAIDHAPSASVVEVRGWVEGIWLELSVIDHGPGLDAEEQQRAFDRFFRGRHPTSGGSGLGLSIVQQLVTASGGSVELVPTDGGGLTVVIRLQVVPVSA
jgi:signal transduction histidine kinase